MFISWCGNNAMPPGQDATIGDVLMLPCAMIGDVLMQQNCWEIISGILLPPDRHTLMAPCFIPVETQYDKTRIHCILPGVQCRENTLNTHVSAYCR